MHPALPPAGWTVLAIPNGVAMSYPPGWKRIVSDSGTATAAVFDGRDHFLGYLNLTPRQSTETLANWGRFRIEHNAEENDRNVTTLAAAAGLRFRSGQGACVRDAYITSTGTRYIELACLARSASVIAR